MDILEDSEPEFHYLVNDSVRLLMNLEKENEQSETAVVGLSDEEFIKAIQNCFQLHSYSVLGTMSLRDSLLSFSGSREPLNARAIERMTNLNNSLDNLQIRIRNALVKKVAILDYGSKPRLVRLAERLKLCQPETDALLFILLQASGIHGAKAYQDRNDIENIRAFSYLSMSQLVSFLSESRTHMKENLIEFDEELASNFCGGSFKMSKVVIGALCGGSLSQEDFFSLEGTTLADILQEEPSFPFSHTEAVNSISDSVENQIESNEPTCDETELEEDRVLELLREINLDASAEKEQIQTEENGSDFAEFLPYSSDLEYLEDAFEVIVLRVRKYLVDLDNEQDSYQISLRQKKPESIVRELEAKERKAMSKWKTRTGLSGTRPKVTPDSDSNTLAWLPRLERLSERQRLDEFEKLVLLSLVGDVISNKVRKATRSGNLDLTSVGTLLGVHCESLESEIRCRHYFYRNSNLIKSGVIKLSERRYGHGDLTDCTATVDRRMLDFLVGLETELSQLCEGGTCYLPSVTFDDVVLPPGIKKLLLDTIRNFNRLKKLKNLVGCDTGSGHSRSGSGNGLVILFHGQSGTGKTLTANALANYMQKKLLNINLQLFSGPDIDEAFEFIFRESKIQEAICFIDECEPLFESRDVSNKVNSALTAIENFDGILLLATNRPHVIDYAMYRRIGLGLEFQLPNSELRESIWKKHLPAGLPVCRDVDWHKLASEYELSGGFIKNAMIQALQFAIAEASQNVDLEDNPRPMEGVMLTMTHLENACRLQVQGLLEISMADPTSLEQHVVPNQGLETLIVDGETLRKLKEVVEYEKVQRALETNTTFGASNNNRSITEHNASNIPSQAQLLCGRNVILIHGPVGSGKSYASRCIAYETSRAMKVVPYPELIRLRPSSTTMSLSTYISSSNGSSRRKADTISSVFKEAEKLGTILCIESAEDLLCPSDRKSSLTQLSTARNSVLYHIKRHTQTIILIATSIAEEDPRYGLSSYWCSSDPLPAEVSILLSFLVPISKPGPKERLRLWKNLTPPSVVESILATNKDKEADWSLLANRYEFVAASIKKCIIRAIAQAGKSCVCCLLHRVSNVMAFLDPGIRSDLVTFEDLLTSCKNEALLMNHAKSQNSLFYT